MTYFLDANIISYVINRVGSVITRLYYLIRDGNDLKIPVVAYYEVKRGLLANNSGLKMSIFENQVENFGLVQMTEKTMDLAASVYSMLKKTGEKIEDDDLFIGCSALENDAVLLTNNARHMEKIPNLRLEILN